MNNSRLRKPSFFFYISLIGMMAVLIGFFKTFISPMAQGSFHAPAIIHIHGAFAFSWVTLFLIQTLLINKSKYKTHQTLGFVGIFIAMGVLVTMVPAGVHVVKRDLKNGADDSAYSSLIGVLTSGILYFSLVIAGIINRKKPETHKRLMLLSLIVVLWPAWFRFRHYFPAVPRPDIWFALVLAYSLIVVAWIWDKIKNGRIHGTLKYWGLFIILEQTFEVYAYDSPLWRSLAKYMFNFLS